ncbi:hypothetical protein GF358_02835 [Candidatus Woesearchaeota archaeon]|nr:hypothetical protein [Candidatus Woesearchaeota archaeon]
MEKEMHPVMKVKLSNVDKKPQYELTLSRANFNYLCAGCPDFDRLVGRAGNGTIFYIFESPHGEMPNSFRPLPGVGGYFAYVGAPVPKIPPGATKDEVVKLAQQASENLERTINKSGRIPIEEITSLGKINLGYVVMNVEKENS